MQMLHVCEQSLGRLSVGNLKIVTAANTRRSYESESMRTHNFSYSYSCAGFHRSNQRIKAFNAADYQYLSFSR